MKPQTLSRYKRVLQEASNLVEGPRDADYNAAGIDMPDYFVHGLQSYHQMVHLKALRLRSQVALFESTSQAGNNLPKMIDTCLDLINYTAFMVMAMQQTLDFLDRTVKNG